jgi:hypothetical protein
MECKTRVVQLFEAETENQRITKGWQAILNNFKNYVEQHLQEISFQNGKFKITPCLWFDNQRKKPPVFMFPFLKIQNGKHKLLYRKKVLKYMEGNRISINGRISNKWTSIHRYEWRTYF